MCKEGYFNFGNSQTQFFLSFHKACLQVGCFCCCLSRFSYYCCVFSALHLSVLFSHYQRTTRHTFRFIGSALQMTIASKEVAPESAPEANPKLPLKLQAGQ